MRILYKLIGVISKDEIERFVSVACVGSIECIVYGSGEASGDGRE